MANTVALPLAVARARAGTPRARRARRPKAIEALALDGPVQTPAYAVDTAGALVNPVDIAVTVDAGAPIAGVVRTRPGRPSVEKSAGNSTSVYLSQSQEASNHDFELKWRLAGGGRSAGGGVHAAWPMPSTAS